MLRLTALRGEIELALRRERTPTEYADALLRLQPVVEGISPYAKHDYNYPLYPRTGR